MILFLKVHVLNCFIKRWLTEFGKLVTNYRIILYLLNISYCMFIHIQFEKIYFY